jgi:hypothetical protein
VGYTGDSGRTDEDDMDVSGSWRNVLDDPLLDDPLLDDPLLDDPLLDSIYIYYANILIEI